MKYIMLLEISYPTSKYSLHMSEYLRCLVPGPVVTYVRMYSLCSGMWYCVLWGGMWCGTYVPIPIPIVRLLVYVVLELVRN